MMVMVMCTGYMYIHTNIGRGNHAIKVPLIMRSSTNKKIAGIYLHSSSVLRGESDLNQADFSTQPWVRHNLENVLPPPPPP